MSVDFLLQALSDAPPEGGVRVATIAAPIVDPERVLAEEGAALFWSVPGAPVHAGVGSAASVTGSGPDRLAQIRDRAHSLWTRLESVAEPGIRPAPPRLFGGAAFLPGPPAPEWTPFGDARFILPRLLYTRHGDEASLAVGLDAEEWSGRGARPIVAEAAGLLDRLSGAHPGPAPSRPRDRDPDHGIAPDALDRWNRAVMAIQERIGAGRAEKIVAARHRTIQLPARPDLPAILRRLDRESATAARFAFRMDGATFVGATPERLVGRVGRRVRTEALAGSVAAGDPERETRLLASLKEEVEHAYVVRAIAAVLEPLCERLDYPDEPRVQRLRHVLHLQTPFDGRLRDPLHVLELVERLHPTPAVGGLPTDEALDWIAREEPGSRGWYAGPIGWFDASGDGEFGVALRSGLLENGCAHLYAGAGIVRDSDAEAEFEETEVKLRTMQDALGLLR